MQPTDPPKHLLSDFQNFEDDASLRKILIIGERGIGKSATLNKLLGFSEFKLPTASSFVTHPDAPFKTGLSHEGITKQTEYVIGRLFGLDQNPEYMFIDMPGVLEDLNQDKNIQKNLNDLTAKLKMLRNVTGVLVLIDSEDYKNAVEVGKEDYINDGVMMILIAIQVIFQEHSDKDFAMNLAFGLARCDPGKEEVWKKLQENKIGVLKAIYDDLKENGIQVPSQNLPLFYLSSQDFYGQPIVQRDEFQKMLNFFESTREDGGRQIFMESREQEPEVIETTEQVIGGLSKIDENARETIGNNLVGMLNEVRSIEEDEMCETDGEDEDELNKKKTEIQRVVGLIQDLQTQIELDESKEDHMKIIFKYREFKPLGFFEKLLFKKHSYNGEVVIEKIENKGFEIVEGGEGEDSIVIQRPLDASEDNQSVITGYGYLKNFPTFKIIQEERKETIRELLKYKDLLER
jgi:hypothetical protein